jgi:hypothetical protein
MNHKFTKSLKILGCEGGYSLIFSILISATLITIGAAMANMALKEFNLVATARASQVAFYAADAGTECALYYDVKESAFQEPYQYKNDIFYIKCKYVDVAVNVGPIEDIAGNKRVINTFQFDFNGGCANVAVTKTDFANDEWDAVAEPDGYGVRTTIDSRGTNVPCSADGSVIKVERALRVRLMSS